MACVAALCAALLGACTTNDADPGPTATDTTAVTSPTESSALTTPAETPPVLPPEAQVQDADGAAAFVRFYFATVNYGYRTGDVEPLLPLRQNDCTACIGIEGEIVEGYTSGGTITGAQVSVVDVAVPGVSPTTGAEAVSIISQEPGVVLDADQEEVEQIGGDENLSIAFTMDWVAPGWIVSQWGSS